MAPPRVRLQPMADPIGRLNERLVGAGRAPMPKGRTPRPTRTSPVLAEAMRATFARSSGSGDGSIRRGATTFDPGSGRGKFERELRAVVADIEEALESGDIDRKRADKLYADLAAEADGLFDEDEAPEWMTNVGLRRKLIREGDSRSFVEKVADAPGGGALLKALDVADTGRAYALAGALELGDAARAAVGKDPMGDRGNIKDSGFSLGDLRENAKRRIGVGDVLEQNTLTKGLPMPVKQGLGLLGDVATDPLTYVTFGAGGVAKNALRAARKTIGEAGEQALRKGGMSALSKADQAALRAALPPKTVQILENAARGGVKVRTPMGKVGSTGKTVIPGEVFRRPARAVKGSVPVQAVAGTAPAKAVKAAGRGLERAFVPRGALARQVGQGVADWADDMRVAMGHTAGQQGLRELDKFLNVARQVPDLELDDLREVGRQMDEGGGGLPAVEPRLQPIYEALDQWRKRLDEAQTETGVLLGKETIDTAREGAVDAASERLLGLFQKQADIEGKLAANRAKVEPVVPRLAPAVGRAAEGGERIGRAQAVIGAVPPVQRRAEQAGERVATLEQRAVDVADAQVPLTTPVDAPITKADVAEAKAHVNDLARRAYEKLREMDPDPTNGAGMPPMPAVRKGEQIAAASEWDWASRVSPEDRAAWNRLADPGSDAAPDQWPDFLENVPEGLSTEEAAAIVLDRVRALTSHEQLARGLRPEWPEYLEVIDSPVDEAILDALPTERLTNNLGRDARGKWTPLGKAVNAAERAVFRANPPKTVKAVLAEWKEMDYKGSVSQAKRIVAADKRARSIVPRLRASGLAGLSDDEIELIAEALTPAQWKVLSDANGQGPLKEVAAKHGRTSWGNVDTGRLVRKMREGHIEDLERHLPSMGLEDLPANVQSYTEPGFVEGRQVGEAGGRVDEAQLVERSAARDVVSAERRATTAVGRAERATDRVHEAVESVETQAERAARQSLERGKRVELTNRSLNARLVKVKQAVKEAEKDLAAAEAAFERSVVDVEHYLPRILTPEGHLVMKAVEDGRIKLPGAVSVRAGITGDRFVSARKPEWAGKSIADINMEQQALMDEALNLGIIKEPGEFFDSNPVTGFATRDLAARRHIIAKQHYEGLLSLRDADGGPVAMRLDDMPDELQDDLLAARQQANAKPGATEAALRRHFGDDEWALIEQPALGVGQVPQTLVVRKELAATVNGFGEALAAPGPVGKFLDDWMKLWKAYATVPMPFGLGFHLRNGQGNVFLNWVVGMRDLPKYLQAAKMQRGMARGIKEHGDPFHYLEPADRVLAEQALDSGAIGEGFFDIEVGGQRKHAVGSLGRTALKGEGKSLGTKINPFSTDNALIAQGRKFGSAVEHNARLAHFLWAMETTGDAAEAARSVRRTLFDYSDVTPFEQRGMKRWWAFYTFVRKSSPVVANAVMTQPYLLSRIQQIRMAMAENAAEDESGGLFPGFLKEGLGVPLPMGVSGALEPLGFDPDEPIVYRPDLPGMGTANILQDLAATLGLDPDKSNKEGFAGLLSLISGGGPGALSAAAQATQGKRLFGDATLTDRPIEASLPARLLDQLIPFADPLTRRRMVDGEMTPSMTQGSDFLFESWFPLAAKVPWGTRQESHKAPRRTLSALTGLSLYPLDEQAQDAEGYQRRDEVRDFAQSLYDRGILRPGADSDANFTERGRLEDEVRADFGIKPDRALTPEARAEVRRRLEEMGR